MPFPETDSKPFASAASMPRSLAPAMIAAASGCSLPRSRAAANAADHVHRSPAAGSTATSFGFPSVSVPVLSTTTVSTFSIRSSASAFFTSTPSRAASDADHDGHRRGQPQRTRAGDDEHRDRVDHRVRQRRLRPEAAHADESDDGDEHDGRDEPRCHEIGQTLNWRPAPLRLADHLDDPRQQRFRSDLGGGHDEAAGGVHRPADHRIADILHDRHRLAGDHRLVDGAGSFDDRAVNRDLFARPDAQPVADVNVAQVDVFLGSIGSNPPRRLRT